MNKTVKHSASPLQFHLIGSNFTDIAPETWNYRNLKSRFWRLYWHDNAGGGITVNGDYIEIDPCHIFLIPPEVIFSTRTSAKLVQLNIHFIIQPFQGVDSAPVLKLKPTPSMEELKELCRQNFSKEDIDRLRINSIALASCFISRLPENTLRKKTENDFQITKLCSSIRNFYHETLSVSSMVKISGLGSPSSLTRKFRSETGTSPYHYLLGQRYRYAAELLRTQNYTIKEICEMISVNDPFHFSRTFKKLYGMSPKNYRKQFTGAVKPFKPAVKTVNNVPTGRGK